MLSDLSAKNEPFGPKTYQPVQYSHHAKKETSHFGSPHAFILPKQSFKPLLFFLFLFYL